MILKLDLHKNRDILHHVDLQVITIWNHLPAQEIFLLYPKTSAYIFILAFQTSVLDL